MAKRANGEGGKPRRRPDGRWEARYWHGGKRKSVYAGSRKECADKLTKAMAAKDDPPAFVLTAMTVAEFFDEYEGAVRDGIKCHSLETTHDIIPLHLKPAFGGARLRDLDRRKIQAMYAGKRAGDLSASRVKRIHDVPAASLNVAVRWGYIDKNPCDGVSKPKIPTPEIRPLSKDEAKRFLEAARDERLEALYVLGLTSDTRWGELAGLQWRDLDLGRRTMHIQRALVNGYGGLAFDTPKTNGSRRSVGLTQRSTDALVRHRERMEGEGHRVTGDALVFVNTVGKPLHGSNFIRRYFTG